MPGATPLPCHESAPVADRATALGADDRGLPSVPLARLGMRHIGTEHRVWENPLPGAEAGEVIYRITAEQWRARAPGQGPSPTPLDPPDR